MRLIEVDSATIDITSAISVGSYTADRARQVFFRLFADGIAANGDYTVYCKVDRGGLGTVYTMQPKTTAEVASGETEIVLETMPLVVNTSDIISVWMLGLAGDTAVDIDCETWEANYTRPLVEDQVDVAVDAGGAVTAGTVSDKTGFSLSGAGILAIWDALTADLDQAGSIGAFLIARLDATVSSIISAVTLGVTSITNNVSGSTVTARRGDGVDLNLTTNAFVFNSGDLLDLILKPLDFKDVEDASSIIWIRKTGDGDADDGLQVLNETTQSGAALAKASLTYNSTIQTRVYIAGDTYAQIEPTKYRFELQHTPTGTTDPVTVAEGTWNTTADVVRATS